MPLIQGIICDAQIESQFTFAACLLRRSHDAVSRHQVQILRDILDVRITISCSPCILELLLQERERAQAEEVDTARQTAHEASEAFAAVRQQRHDAFVTAFDHVAERIGQSVSQTLLAMAASMLAAPAAAILSSIPRCTYSICTVAQICIDEVLWQMTLRPVFALVHCVTHAGCLHHCPACVPGSCMPMQPTAPAEVRDSPRSSHKPDTGMHWSGVLSTRHCSAL